MNTGNFNLSKLSRHDLPRLWPVISTTLYPESESRLRSTVKEVVASNHRGDAWEELIEAINVLQELIETHYKETAELIKQRLQSAPYGNAKFEPGYFPEACKLREQSSNQIKKQWKNIRNIARGRLSKSLNTPENKLVYARLNSLEQDILYVLFVEQHYLCPLIRRKSDA